MEEILIRNTQFVTDYTRRLLFNGSTNGAMRAECTLLSPHVPLLSPHVPYTVQPQLNVPFRAHLEFNSMSLSVSDAISSR